MLDGRRLAVLDAMGVELWRSRTEAGQGARPAVSTNEPAEKDSPAGSYAASEPSLPSPAADRLAETAQAPQPAESGPLARGPDPVGSLDWPALQQAVEGCQACGLHETRTQTVFGVGDRQARLMVIGEAPGAEEDRQGEPFVGRAGQLLNAMLEAIGFARDQVYIANIVKCRPPGNRDPHADEAAACRTYLLRQIELIRPALILSAGRVSAHNLLGTDLSVGRLRGRVHRLDPGDVPLIVTYHPAYLLRRPQEKAKSWQDLQSAWRLLNDA